MTSLFLKKEYDIIRDADKAKKSALEKLKPAERPPKAELQEQEHEKLLKLLIRCQRMHEAKEEVVRILLRVNKREELMRQFGAELWNCSEDQAKGYYFMVLKFSHKLFNQIERLRVDHPMLNRPFVYRQESLQTTLVRDQFKIRRKLIKRFPNLEKDLDRVLDKSGQAVKLEHI